MKNLKYLIFAAVILLTVSSCRKGEDDPLFSIHSRKARLTKEWVIKQGNYTTTYIDGDFSNSLDYEITEDSITYDASYGYMTMAYSEYITFNDETFTIKSEQDYFGLGIMTITYSGKWSFMSSGNEYANKERVELIIETMETDYLGQTTTESFSDKDPVYILFITRLSKDELNFDFEFSFSGSTVVIETIGTKKFVKK